MRRSHQRTLGIEPVREGLRSRSTRAGRAPVFARVLAFALVVAVFAVGGAALAPRPAAAQGSLPRLDPIELEADRLSLRLRGHDPGAPRALVLWRSERGAERRVATTRSSVGGRFDFGEQPIPIAATAFFVVPEGTEPTDARRLELRAPLPAPILLSDGAEGHAVTLVPALARGQIEIRDGSDGRLLLRREASGTGWRSLEIDFSSEGLLGRVDRVTIVHVLEDGRRSPALRWDLDPPTR